MDDIQTRVVSDLSVRALQIAIDQFEELGFESAVAKGMDGEFILLLRPVVKAKRCVK